MPHRPDSILAAFLAHAQADPARPCVIWRGATLSYGALAELSAAWAARYRELGVARGDRVALYLGSSPAFLSAYLGAHMAGAAVVLINTQYRQVELEHILNDSEPRLIVADQELAVEHEASRADGGARWPTIVTPDPETYLPAGVSKASSTPYAQGSIQLPEAADLAILAYTSGTTGRSKGAMLTHGCLAANSTAVLEAWRWTAADRLLLTLPLFHIHGLGVGVHGTLLAGASLDLRPRFDAAEVLDTLAGGEHTLFFGVPTLYTRLIAEARRRQGGDRRPTTDDRPAAADDQLHARVPRFPLPVRLFVSGSAPLAQQTFAEFEELFGQRILERYGMTETGMNLTNPYDGERRPGSVGMPFPGQEARVVDLKTREELPDGEVGEIQVRGPHVCAGYWRNPEATAEVFHPDGWFSTGDLGWRSADGYFTITGRAKELIISGGYNIYPREVEELLLIHPGVAECAVFGLPDPEFGEQVAAAIVPSDPANPPIADELIAFCREHLAAYKRPRMIRYVEALPRNAMGKIEKHRLRGW